MALLFLLSYAGTVEPEAGDDPATCGLRNRCSTSVSYPGAKTRRFSADRTRTCTVFPLAGYGGVVRIRTGII